jgi:hypothetical protein
MENFTEENYVGLKEITMDMKVNNAEGFRRQNPDFHSLFLSK